MKKIYLIIAVILFASPAPATVPLVGGEASSTYNCTEWDQGTDGNNPNCDGLGGFQLSNYCVGTNGTFWEKITTDANYPGGGGGRGQRHWMSRPTYPGPNAESAGLNLFFPSLEKEYWFRFYTRIQSGAGFSGFGAYKIIYLHGTEVDSFIGYILFPDTTITDRVRYYEQSGGKKDLDCTGCGFVDTYGGEVSDGSWFALEVHIKAESTSGASDGIFQMWKDGVLIINRSDAEYGSPSGFIGFKIGSNTHGTTTPDICTYSDFDDWAVSTNGYIGPIGTTDTNSPAITNASPSGAQNCIESDSTQDTTVSFTASDASPTMACELGTVSTFTFGTGTAMSPSAGGSGATFSHTFTDQACGASYTYYPKCRDSATSPNTTSDAESSAAAISYSIGTYASEANPPVVTLESPSSGAELVCIYNPRDVIVQASATDATPPIAMKISSINDFDYDTQGSAMTPEATGNSGETFSYIFSGGSQLACDASYTYYIKARDAEGNTSAQTTASFSIAAEGTAQVIMSESFENENFSSRSWYDGAPTAATIASGGISGNCAKFTFAQGNTTPTGWQTIRRAFTPSEELTYVVWWKFANDFVGSGSNGQPHVILTLSDQDSTYSSIASNYLNFYVETNGLIPRIQIQDNLNINYSQGIPYNFTQGVNQTESRSANKCNGYLSTQSVGTYQDCFSLGGGLSYSATHWNGSASFNRNTWNKDEVYVRLNSIVNGAAVANGIIERKVNDVSVLYVDNAVMRTGENPGIKLAQLVIAPYIGAGSPVDQTFYIDELSLFGGRLIETPPPTTPGRFNLTNVNSGATAVTVPGDIPVTVYP